MNDIQKAALRARGYTEDQIFNMRPEEMQEILTTTDPRAVRYFFEIIVAQARAATQQLQDPGVLQMLLIHPLDEAITIYRYTLDDNALVERMTSDAVNASESGHNVYIEGRTVRRGLKGKERGGLKDTVAVFGLVVDSDADKGKAWTPTVPISLAVETSPGNRHDWLFFETALELAIAQPLGTRLRAATGGDADTGVITQPYRVAGTVNYPNKSKLERGRIVTGTRTLNFDLEMLWTVERFEREFPAPAGPNGGGDTVPSADGVADESSIPADTLKVIYQGIKDDHDRSRAFWNVMMVLTARGWTVDGIVALLEKHPKGIALKYLEYKDRLRPEVKRAWDKLIGDSRGKDDDGGADEAYVDADTQAAIKDPSEDGHGKRFYKILLVLKAAGFTVADIITRLERYPDGIALRYEGRLHHEVERVWAKLGEGGGPKPALANLPSILSQKDFLAGFEPPDYIVDGVLQRRYIYSLTAVTGHGKTAIALSLARATGCEDPNATFGGHAAEKGQVVYFVGENPDDVRCRIIGANSKRSDDPDQDRILYIPGVFDIAALRAELVAAIDKLGGTVLVIIDTSAAYFLKDDENSNPQMGEHARMLRSLTGLPGGPCVVVLCHPIKHVIDPSQLLPRGGGAFTAEIDGNLTAWKHDDNLVTFHHSPDKFRGPGFEPITFRLEKITTPKLVDKKGRMMPTVHAVAISEQEEKEQEASAEHDEDLLLAQVNGQRSVADLARACDWMLPRGDPHKSKVDRVANRLREGRLIKKVRGRHWQLTPEGKRLLKQGEEEDETVDDRSGASNSKRRFHALQGSKQRPTVPCTFCGQTGEVYQFADGRLPKGQRHHSALHRDCAEAYFTGQPKPQNGGGKSDPLSH